MKERDTDGLVKSLGFLINNTLYGIIDPKKPTRYVSREEIKEMLERKNEKEKRVE